MVMSSGEHGASSAGAFDEIDTMDNPELGGDGGMDLGDLSGALGGGFGEGGGFDPADLSTETHGIVDTGDAGESGGWTESASGEGGAGGWMEAAGGEGESVGGEIGGAGASIDGEVGAAADGLE